MSRKKSYIEILQSKYKSNNIAVDPRLIFFANLSFFGQALNNTSERMWMLRLSEWAGIYLRSQRAEAGSTKLMLRLSEWNKTCFNFTRSISNIAEGIGSQNHAEQRYFALLSMTGSTGSTAISLPIQTNNLRLRAVYSPPCFAVMKTAAARRVSSMGSVSRVGVSANMIKQKLSVGI